MALKIHKHVKMVQDEGINGNQSYPYVWFDPVKDEDVKDEVYDILKDAAMSTGELLLFMRGVARLSAHGYDSESLIKALDEHFYVPRMMGEHIIQDAFTEILNPIVEGKSNAHVPRDS